MNFFLYLQLLESLHRYFRDIITLIYLCSNVSGEPVIDSHFIVEIFFCFPKSFVVVSVLSSSGCFRVCLTDSDVVRGVLELKDFDPLLGTVGTIRSEE